MSISSMYTSEGKNTFIPEFEMTVGTMQQKIGTEVFRDNFDQDVWVKSLFASYKSDKIWIITDVRFENEAAYIKRLGGTIIRTEGDPAGIRKDSTRDLNHPSETGLDEYEGFDMHCYNIGSLEDLEKDAIEIIKKLNL